MISGQILKDGIISGANNISNHKDYVNHLNVFPVPDGDTGSNMARTVNAAKIALEHEKGKLGVGEVAKLTASALLRGARGNSGVILSLIFRGLSRELEMKDTANASDFARALLAASEAAYGAVAKPTEGTMLTVIRLVAQESERLAKESNNFADFWDKICNQASEALAQTPQMLPVLAEAGVVDSGGQGLVFIFEGMKRVFAGEGIIEVVQANLDVNSNPEIKVSTTLEKELEYCYCTELLIKKNGLCDAGEFKQFLEQIGSSIVLVDDSKVIKVHVHTNHPGLVLEKALELGELSDPKINNLKEECEEKAKKDLNLNVFEYKPVEEDRAFGFVAVAAGVGVIETFLSLGVDNIVSGGQTMNPSTEELVNAVHATPAQTVFVLPNNKNIVMTAQQAALLADREVVVLPSRTVPQGMSAMLAFDVDLGLKANWTEMSTAIERVKTGIVTFAARDSVTEGKEIKAGDILAIESGKIKYVAKDYFKICLRLVKSMTKKADNYITIFYGEDVEQTKIEWLRDQLRQKFSDFEVNLIYGGQPIHYFIVSVE